jgi:hypothetical protein
MNIITGTDNALNDQSASGEQGNRRRGPDMTNHLNRAALPPAPGTWHLMRAV